ncbi:MAG TPA: response regulator transcription factor [Hanamia sp.]|nr:response regulator transcription factor [Hanamia sp.]
MPDLLIVDDHAIVRTGLKMVVQDFLAQCNIDEAEDGDSAFAKVRSHDYDLIMLDVNMPNTDSFGLVTSILTLKPGVKIIMFSMNAEEIYAKRYLKMGAMGYLRKDAPGDEIQKAIQTVLNDKKYISEELSQKLLNEMNVKGEDENPFDKLSPREFEIVQHLANGESVAEISKKLSLHTSTIGTHKARIFDKLQCHNIIEINKLAKAHHIIFPN